MCLIGMKLFYNWNCNNNNSSPQNRLNLAIWKQRYFLMIVGEMSRVKYYGEIRRLTERMDRD